LKMNSYYIYYDDIVNRVGDFIISSPLPLQSREGNCYLAALTPPAIVVIL